MAFIVHCYDLLIKNGTVVDPVLGLNKKMDVGIYASRIADVFEPGSLPGKICGHKVIDASGMYVVPGLVDGHVHVLPGLRFTYPIDELWKRGITACIDMGSQTSASFHRERHLIDEAPCMVNACLGLSNMAETQGEIPRYALLRQVCDAVGCRMFVHVANPDVPLPELIDYFYPGDNFTHTYNKGNILDQDGHVYKEAWEAKRRGVIFDSARGSRNWSSEVAKAAFAEGFFPDVITDDLTALSNDPQTSRLTVHMGECMALGMSSLRMCFCVPPASPPPL